MNLLNLLFVIFLFIEYIFILGFNHGLHPEYIEWLPLFDHRIIWIGACSWQLLVLFIIVALAFSLKTTGIVYMPSRSVRRMHVVTDLKVLILPMTAFSS